MRNDVTIFSPRLRTLVAALALVAGAGAITRPAPVDASRIAAVAVAGILPKTGSPGDSFDAQVRGSGFQNGATVSLGDDVTVQVESVDTRGRIMDVHVEIDAAAQPGVRDVVVTLPGGDSGKDPNGFRVLEDLPPGPQVGAISPTKGQQGQTMNVTINGSGFQQGATVSFGAGIIVNSAQVSSIALDHIITANITIDPSATLGKRDVSVRNPGTESTVKEDAFEVVAAASGKLVVAPKKLKFPAVKLEKFKTKKLKIKNTGEGVLNGTITPPAEGGPFVMNPQQTQYSLEPGETLTLNVEFRPTIKGKATGELVVTSDDPDKPSVTIPLSGKGK